MHVYIFFRYIIRHQNNAITAVSHYPGSRNSTSKNSEPTNLSYSHTCLQMSRSHSRIIRFSRLSSLFSPLYRSFLCSSFFLSLSSVLLCSKSHYLHSIKRSMLGKNRVIEIDNKKK